jgi:hypothetical protein
MWTPFDGDAGTYVDTDEGEVDYWKSQVIAFVVEVCI